LVGRQRQVAEGNGVMVGGAGSWGLGVLGCVMCHGAAVGGSMITLQRDFPTHTD
jgi:hypothetical protein